MCIILKFPLHSRLLAAVVHVMRWVEKCRQQSRKWQCRNEPHPPCGLVAMQYLLGAGGTVSGGGGHDVGVFDELRPMLLSMGPILKMDSNMMMNLSYSESYWLPESDTNQSKAEQGEITEISSVMFGLSLAYTLQCIIIWYYSMILINTLCVRQ